MVSRRDLLEVLPPFSNDSVLIEPAQGVPDIIKEVLNAHKYFAADYDEIYQFFDQGQKEETARRIFKFLKKNVRYEVEGDEKQTTKSPAALVAMGYGDCKHYAGFIAGVLDAIERNTGQKINWAYRFGNYQMFDTEPGHVFVVINPGGNEIWVDPVLENFDEKLRPYSYTDKKIKAMPLYRISGLGEADGTEALPQDVDIVPDIEADPDDSELTQPVIDAIDLLLHYNVVNTNGEINQELLDVYSGSLPPAEYEALVNSVSILHTARISGLFQTIFRGVKKVTLSIPRGAYLSIVALNVFGTGSKLKEATKDTDGANKVRDIWYKLGGDWNVLQQAIKNGSGRARILGIGVAQAALPAWVLTATAIIAAMTPVITQILKARQQSGTLDPYFSGSGMSNDDLKALGLNNDGSSNSGSVSDFLKNNLLWIALGGGALIYYFSRRKR